jgi:hypothetical protein
MNQREFGRVLAGSRDVGMRRADCGECPRVAVMAFDPGLTR